MDTNFNSGRICWPIILLLVLQQFVSSKSYLAVCIFFAALLCLKYCRIFPYRLPSGIGIYIVWGIIATFIGLNNGSGIRYIIRTESYFLSGIIAVFLGTVLVLQYSRYDICKTIVFLQFLETCYCFVNLLFLNGFNFNNVRSALATDLSGLEFIFPFFIFDILTGEREFFGKGKDKFVLGIFIIRIALCLSRTTLVGIICGCIIYYIFLDKRKRENAYFVYRISVVLILIIAIVYLITVIAPDSVVNIYFTKFQNLFDEVSINHSYNSYSEALSNWRGYENAAALEQWSNYGIITKCLGIGFGGLIHMQFISSEWAQMEFYSLGGIPLLHNSFFTVLCIGGVFGFVSLVYFFGSNCLYGLRIKKHYGGLTAIAGYVTLIVMMALNTYVTTGFFSSSMYLTWGILLAYYKTCIIEDLNY